MNGNNIIKQQYNLFENAAHNEDGIEFWYARELQLLLEYTRWESFAKVIDKAKLSCKSTGYNVIDHFQDVTKMVKLGGHNVSRNISDTKLTRYACYLIAQNGDPKKSTIAFAQTYFAVQTRRIEVLEQCISDEKRLEAREKLRVTENRLSGIAYERGVNDRGFAKLRSKGDKALFGGFTTADMKKKLGVPSARPLADFLPTVNIKAKDLAAEMTRLNVEENCGIYGEDLVTDEHVKSNESVRGALINRNIYPEKQPADEDIKKVERRVAKERKKLKSKPKEMGDG
uniref:DNA-damage-inducible protein D n=1 Tax=Candidatus Kentrum sp. FW TaxID=2126338 RepID=A0A450TB41_9GAMM|nr:MAG: DNA-damage-inducible protein D [Candidatus Kentron sp. FW]